MDDKSILIEALLNSIRLDLKQLSMAELKSSSFIQLNDTKKDDSGVEYGVTDDGRAVYRVSPGLIEHRQETFSLDD